MTSSGETRGLLDSTGSAGTCCAAHVCPLLESNVAFADYGGSSEQARIPAMQRGVPVARASVLPHTAIGSSLGPLRALLQTPLVAEISSFPDLGTGNVSARSRTLA